MAYSYCFWKLKQHVYNFIKLKEYTIYIYYPLKFHKLKSSSFYSSY